MCDDLIDYFFKKNEDRKMDWVSFISLTIIIAIYSIIFIFLNTDILLINIFLVFLGAFLPAIILYVYIFLKVEKRIDMKKICSIKNVLKNYREYRINIMFEIVESFLKSNSLYTKEKISFILGYVSRQKKGKFQRDWFSLIIQVVIAIFLAFISGKEFYFEGFITVLFFLIIISLFMAIFYYTIFFQYRNILGNILFKNSSIIQLEKILSDIYLSMLE